jgi:hypothetical protein
MKLFFSSLLSLLLFCSTAHAVETPFSWPEAYSYTTKLTSKSSPSEPFINKYNRSGLMARNDNEKLGVLIMRIDMHRKFLIKPDGTVEKTFLPPGWPMTNIFPRNRKWELQGKERLNGVPALKYKITRDPASPEYSKVAPYVFFWLSTDKKTPLKMEDGDAILEFSDYVVAPQDDKLFAEPGK